MALKRDPYTKPLERARMGGSRGSPGPGGGMPSAKAMDRPSGDQRAFARHGDSTKGMDRGIKSIQDQDPRGRR